jgi:diguanylate cyclase (GGDEF)-like protein
VSGKPFRGRPAQELSDRDQTASDLDQSAADLDQTLSDDDRFSAELDQQAADRDQASADRDQATIDEHQSSVVGADLFAQSRRDRSQSTRERDISSEARSAIAMLRDENAERRDRLADERDAASKARDRLAAKVDAEVELLDERRASEDLEPAVRGVEFLRWMADERRRASQARIRAAAYRDAAALDRDQAARDREHSAADRQEAVRELAIESVDFLTGALRRRTGLAAIGREMDRTARSQEPLVVAFVDVDGLKAINDSEGHPAGDNALRAVAGCIRQGLRSYDVVTRFGGDEFVCSIAGQDLTGARQRFDEIAVELSRESARYTITVGFALRGPRETIDEVIDRADAAMIAKRPQRSKHHLTV